MDVFVKKTRKVTLESSSKPHFIWTSADRIMSHNIVKHLSLAVFFLFLVILVVKADSAKIKVFQ